MKSYTVVFGQGNPQGNTGLAPTFLSFVNLATGTTNAPPSITETITGKTGIYTFSYGVTQPISFLIDAATTSPGPTARYVVGQIDPSDRSDEYGNTLTAIGFSGLVYGSSLTALGNAIAAQGVTLTAIGFSGLVYGSSNIALGTTSVAYLAGINLGGLGASLSAIGTTLANIGLFLGDTTASIGNTAVNPVNVFGFLMRAQQIMEGAQIYTKASGLLAFFNTSQTTMLVQKTIVDTSSQTSKT